MNQDMINIDKNKLMTELSRSFVIDVLKDNTHTNLVIKAEPHCWFDNAPEYWNECQTRMFDTLTELESRIQNNIKNILNNKESDTKNNTIKEILIPEVVKVKKYCRH